MNKADVVDIYRLSPIQQGILFHSLYSPETAVYFDQFVWHLPMPIDIPAFVQAWQRVVDHHPILRTSFFWEDLDEPLQVVSRQVEVPFTLIDWRDVPADQQAARFADYLARDREQGVNFAEPPLTRLALFQTGDAEYRFVWSYHHILLDGWSISLLLNQVLKLYDALRNGQNPPLKRARPYRDYITWLRGHGVEQAETFWRSTLRGFTNATPLDSFATDAHLTNAAPELTEQRLVFSPETTAQLQQLARQQRITLSTMLQAAWALLLSRYSGEEDIVYGMTVSGRSPKLAGSEGMIGVFINTLPVRVRITQDTPLIVWLEQLQQQLIELAQYESTPLLDIQQWSEVPRGQPLFESIVVFENFPFESAERNRSLHFVRRTNYALTIVGEARPNLVVDIAYDRRRFDAALIERMQQHLRIVLETMLHQPDQPLGQIASLTPDEQQQLAAWNNTSADYSLHRCLQELVEDQAARTPDAPALVFGDQHLSYAELNRRANQLAHYLRARGIQSELPIGLCVERSPELLIGLLAILKAGGVYVPLDPAYPQDRLGFMLADAQIRVLLTTSRLCERLPDSDARIVCLDDEWSTVAAQPADNLRGVVQPDNLAYIMYTSGSTGRPKGVQNSHRAIVNRLLWSQEHYPLSPEDRVLQIASFSFDIALWELLGPLLAGAQVILARPGGQQESGYLVRLMAEQRVTIAHFVPSLLQVLLAEPDLHQCDELRLVFCGGEALPSDLPARFFAQLQADLVQFYGPTEASINATAWHFDRGRPQAGVPIGRPIANTQVHLLDRHLRPVPIGVAGEIYIGGVGVARGYLNRPDQTAEKFVPDSFAQNPGSRLYRTGDRGRFLSDGVLQFLGRTDQQVKIRGFRVELGEIEAVLRQHPAVAEAVVVARQDTADTRLVAYVVEEQRSTADSPSPVATGEGEGERSETGVRASKGLRAFLAERLPDYMIPAAFVALDALPLTPTGKIDRRALPAPERLRDEAEAGAAEPSTPTEQMLAVIWSSILGVEQVSRFDHFFELGGHSLKATQVITRIRDAFEVELPLRVLFESPTVAELAARIDAARSAALADNVPPLVSLPRDRPMPLSFAQQRLWFLDQLVPGNPFYNMLSAIQLTGRLNQAALRQALGQVVRRHEALRTTFVATDGQPMQVIAPEINIALPVIDCGTLPEAEREEQVRQLAVAEAQKPFDLTYGPLLRVSLIRLSDDQHVLLLAMHHIVSDGWSMGILIDELARAYSGCIEDADHHAPLAPLPVQYADFAIWQRAWLAPGTPGAVLEQQLAYWKQHLGGDLPVLDLPTDHPRPLVQSFRGATQRFLFPKALHEGLVSLSQREGATLFMTLLAAWQILLFRYSGQDDILTSSPIANRTRREIEGLIGFFVNTLVLRTDLSGNPSFRELLGRVREAALGAYAHQDLPFEYLVEQLHPQRDLSRQPIFQVAFVLQNAPLPPLRLEDLTLSVLDVDSGTAKFDLTLYMWERVDGLGGALEYATDLFDAPTISRMIGHLQMLLDQIVADPARSIGQVPLLAAPEHEQLRTLWRTAQIELPPTTIQALIEEQVARTPAAGAVVFSEQTLSYADLNQRANHLAHYLQVLGVGPDVRVGVCMERSPEMIVGIVGILKAGGAYVPIDPTYPRERIQLMLADAQAPLLLTHERQRQLLPQTQARIVALDAEWPEIARQPLTNPSHRATADHLAYVIYTSGSTGRPKGTLITQRGLCNLVAAQIAAFEITPTSRVLQFASLSFDASASEIFTALVAGASLHLVSRDVMLSPPDLARLMREQQITTVTLPPALLALLPPENLPHLAVVVSAGEACSTSLATRWLDQTDGHTRRLINAYGPTEATIGPTYYVVSQPLEEGADVPIGRPIPNIQAYVLDAYSQPTPLGVPGELYIGGVGVARGYLNQPALTAAQFVPDPFSQPGARMYRTGDRARFRTDGNLEFLGRIDEQVKVRGFRIELNEIEAVLSQHPAVREAVVTAHDQRLVAYVVTEQENRVPSGRTKEQENQEPEAKSEGYEENGSRFLVLGSSDSLEQIDQWQQLFDETYREVAPDYDPTFNVSGWNSSYSGQPIPEQQMRLWVEQTVARIKALRPRRVLEIGCGTGLLLFRIAPECEQYVGTDFSRAALHSVEQLLGPRNLSHVTLLHRPAHDFSAIQPGSFDTVILNSVVQYFPSAEYLTEVLAGAVRAVAPGGRIFIGDARSLPLLEAFHASVNFYQSSSALTSAQLLQRIQTRLMHEEELAIDPAFFTALQQQLPQLSLVDARLKRGRNDNELTRFRYDVVLHVGPPDTPPTPAQTLDWQQAGLSVAAVRRLLAEQTPDALTIRRVPNARVQADVALVERIRAAEGTETVGDLRRGVSSGGVEPEDLWALSDELPYAVGIGWSGAGADGCFDVTFRRATGDNHGETIAAVEVDPAQLEVAHSYTNNPLQGRLVRRLIPQLRRFLEPRLPEYMLPSAFVGLPALPRTPNGKLNRSMLPEPEGVRPALDVGYIGPRTEIERAVAAVWVDVLQVERVGMDDNFFDLGGHSLLLVQLHSKLVQTLGREISVIDLFKYPTISALAEYLRLDTAAPTEAAEPDAEPVVRQSENRREGMRRQKDLRQRHRATKQQAGDEDDD